MPGTMTGRNSLANPLCGCGGHGADDGGAPTSTAHVRPAGLNQDAHSMTAAEVMRPLVEEEVPEKIKFYRSLQNAEVGVRTPLYKSAPLPAGATYGIKTRIDPSEGAARLINPPKPSKFQEALRDAKKPVLKSTALAEEHKTKLITSDLAFGEPSEHGGSAAECVNPDVSRAEIEALDQSQAELYRKSHGSYLPGEQVERGYDGDFDKTAVCGVPTPQDMRGGGVAKTLRWTSTTQQPPLVSSLQKDHAEGPPKPAAVQDPNTVYGIVTRPIGDTVNTLIKTAGPAEDSAALREQIQSIVKPTTIAKLSQLDDEFVAADEAQTGTVPERVARELCGTHVSELGPRILDTLLEKCTTEPGSVDWTYLMDLLRPPVPMMADDARPCGTSTIRTDLTAPKFVSVTETRNFGDQGTAKLVVNPTRYTALGVAETKVVNGRTKDELKLIFETAGLQQSHDFEEVWAKATTLSKSELVSVEVFQQALM